MVVVVSVWVVVVVSVWVVVVVSVWVVVVVSVWVVVVVSVWATLDGATSKAESIEEVSTDSVLLPHAETKK